MIRVDRDRPQAKAARKGGGQPLKASLVAGALCLLLTSPMSAGTSGSAALFTPSGHPGTTSLGDPISSNQAGGFNTFYRYYIEVPPGTSQLDVDIFDADVLQGTDAVEAPAGRDRQRFGNTETAVTYTLFDPFGTSVATRSCNMSTMLCAAAENAWTSVDTSGTVLPIVNPAPGHWELRVDQSTAAGASGQNINAFGVRAYETSAATGDRELNVYYPTFSNYGVNDDANSRTYTQYPYVASDCNGDSNDFDFDSNNANLLVPNSVTYTSRTGAFTQTFSGMQLSGNDIWANNVLMGWTTDSNAVDYGIWTMELTIGQVSGQGGNYGLVYFGNTQTPDPPPSPVNGVVSNTFRIYLAQDGVDGNTPGGAPVKPYLEQQLTHTGNGPNPPQVGMMSQFAITVRVVNPTPYPITFDSLTTDPNVVTAFVPDGGGDIVFNSFGPASQGTTAVAGGGPWDLTWAPGTVAAGDTAFFSYLLDTTPSAAGQLVLTGTAVSNGTSGFWVDETCSGAAPACTGLQLTNATFSGGPACELAVNTTAPTPVLVSAFAATARSGAVVLEWETAAEAGTVGLDLYRVEEGAFIKLNDRPLLAMLAAPQGGQYRFVDDSASPYAEAHEYVIVETEASGGQRVHGPFEVAVDWESDVSWPDGLERLAHPPGERFLARREAAARERAAQAAKSSALVAGTAAGLKIAVEEAGLYRLEAREIANLLGLPPRQVVTAINSYGFRLTHRGDEVAWRAAAGGGALDFYAEEIDSPFTAQNVYVLRQATGLAMGTLPIAPQTAQATGTPFRDTLDLEEDLTPVPALPLDPEGDIWFWDYVQLGSGSHGSRALTVELPDVARTEGTARLVVRLQGASQGSHTVAVRVNGTLVGTAGVVDLASTTTGLFVPQDLLHTGVNTIDITSTAGNAVWIDGFDLTYQRQRRAVDGALLSSDDRDAVVTVAGFPDAGIRVFDVSDPYAPQELIGVNVAGSAGGPGQPTTYLAAYDALADHAYLAVSNGGIKRPAALTVDVASDLLAPSWAVDYLVITTAGLQAAAQELAAYRAGQGLTTLVVELEDIYDEFNHGIADPRVIRDFLAHAHTSWVQAPRYVVLAGAGTYDYQDRWGHGDVLIPPLLRSRGDSLFASDLPYVDVDGEDGIPEMAIGRIPVVSAAELSAYVDKVIAYESQAQPAWSDRVMLLSDNPDVVGSFTDESAHLASLLPGGFRVEAVALDQHPSLTSARQQLFAGLDTGAAVVSYLGHGAPDRLAAEGLLTSADIPVLSADGGPLPLLSAVTCHIALHALPGFDAIGELMVIEPERGAIAVWAPGWVSQHSDGKILGDRLFRELFHKGETTLGDAVRQAMSSAAVVGTPKVLLETYQLLGDPALRLWVVPDHPPGTDTSGGGG